ncbi:hypothetical protein HanPSC8_Chr04g0174861 [Helianthus annuus]|nr:hypothetical protein HanPSC8_Chr04g0174861 [Helianthus annuus]
MEYSGTGEKGLVGSEVGCLLGVGEKQRRRGRGWQPRRMSGSAAAEDGGGQGEKGV